MAKISAMVDVDDQHLNYVKAIAEAYKHVGLENLQVYELAGCFGADVDAADLPKLKCVKDVARVDIEKTYSRPPFDPNIPQ